MSLDPKNHEISRDLILKELKHVKEKLIEHVETGNRDFEVFMKLVNQYIDLQYTSDVLSGQTKVG